MKTNRLLKMVALCGLVGGCAQQTGSTMVRVAPVGHVGPKAVAEYDLRATDGRELARVAVTEGVAVREAQGRHVVRAGLTVENLSGKRLALPASELYLDNLGPQRVALTEVSDAVVPELIEVGPGERRGFELMFLLPTDRKVDDVKSLQLHWVVLLDGVTVGQQVTQLASVETTRQYRDFGMRSVSTMDDQARINSTEQGWRSARSRRIPVMRQF